MNTLIFTALLWGAWKIYDNSKNTPKYMRFIDYIVLSAVVIGAILFALVNLK